MNASDRAVHERPRIERAGMGTVLRRGLRRRCPRCGDGALFQRGIKPYERCSACDLLFQRDYGDTWIFIILTDRIPILFGIAAVYFGFHPQTWPAIFGFFLALAAPLVATMRQRQGLALALDYLSRAHFANPDDEIHRPASRRAVETSAA